jgi:T-complex protein 11
MWAFFKGFANLLLPSKIGTRIPDTFMFDEERIIKLRSDILDAINLEICSRLFRELHNDSRPKTSKSRSPLAFASSDSLSSGSSFSSLPGTKSSPPPDFSQKVNSSDIAKDAGRYVKPAFSDRLVWVPESGASKTDPRPSARRTFSSTASASSPCSPIQTETSSIEETLRHSILAIIEDTLGDNRWSQNCSSIALQILRSCPSLQHHPTFSQSFEKRLQFHLSNTFSSHFLICESHILSELYPLLSNYVTRYAHLTSTQLFEVATTPRVLPFQPPVPRHTLQDVSRQMAHIGILHWRVWAPLTYLVNPDADDTGTMGPPSDGRGRESRSSDRDAQMSPEERRRSPPRQGSVSESIPTQS